MPFLSRLFIYRVILIQGWVGSGVWATPEVDQGLLLALRNR